MSLFGINVRTCVLSHFSLVRLLVTPWAVASEAPLSMGFSRQEYWSGLPFPSPLESAENCNFRPATTAYRVQISPSRPRSPALQADSLSTEPQGKSKTTGVGSLSCLQQIFPTQESNWGLLHCRRILYQLSYQGSQELSYDPAISLLGIFLKKTKAQIPRVSVHPYVYCSIIYSC